ncbi:hypothetical protein RRG08_013511 [Elysia crispata]|uniref:WW domain-containing protein n=1 Tax=Elysia crispata TaxID=231223 RepID=A0AAE0Y0V8_9GAST|nr:hypothetical protein RRG08_013511 [Elysia crispata]
MQSNWKAPKWVPPLPHGWEAKFDPGQHTYFFINHQTKTTQWEDPRFQKSTAAESRPTAAAAATSLKQSGTRRRYSPTYESLQMRDFRTPASGDQRAQLRQSQGESSLINPETIVQKLQAEFPAATRELISDMLSSCQNNEVRTRQEMRNLGFAVKPSSSSSSSGAGHSVSTVSVRAVSPTRKASQGASPTKQQQQPKPQVASATATPKREVSDAEKARIMNQLKGEFPNSDPSVVIIAARTCEFDVEKTRELIMAFEKKGGDQERSSRTRGGATSSGQSSSSSSQPVQPSQQSLLPAGLSDESPQGGQSGASNHHRLGHTKGSVTRGESGSAKVVTTRSPQPQHVRAQQVTRMSEHLLNTTSDLLSHLTSGASCCPREEHTDRNVEQGREDSSSPASLGINRPRQKTTRQTAVVTLQPGVVTHKTAAESSFRTATAGPNRELCRGPDSSLLM